MLFHRCPGLFPGYLCGVFFYIFDAAVFHDQFCRRLLPHARKPRNVVRAVSHERLEFDDLRGRYLIFFFYIFCMKIFNGRLAAHRPRQSDHDTVGGKLQKVPVSRKDSDFHAFLFASFGYRAKKIVRFVPLLFDHRDAHGRQHFLQERYLLYQFIRHLVPCAFILRIFFMPEGRYMQVKSDRQIVGLFLLQYSEHDGEKAVYGAGMHSFAVRQIGQAVKRTIDHTVSVDQQYFFTHV